MLFIRFLENFELKNCNIFRTRFEQEEHIYLHDEDSHRYPNFEPELNYQILKIDPVNLCLKYQGS